MEKYIIYWSDGTKELFSCFNILTLLTKIQKSSHGNLVLLVWNGDFDFQWDAINNNWQIKT